MRLRQLTFAFSLLLASSSALLAQQQGADQQVVLTGEDDGPVVLYDGKEISQRELTEMDISKIGDISILTGEQAQAKFGKYAEFGAIVVTSASNASVVTETVTTGTVAAGAPSEPVAAEVKMSFSPDINYYVILDGQPSDMATLNALDPNRIDEMQVHGAVDAMELFGDKAKEGAIVVTTKR